MIELRTLGAIDLRWSDGSPITAVLAQSRRLALLVYLAKGGAAPLPGVHRRDVLLALFWPDADDERARVALKAAIHFLRRALGDGVIVNRGASEIAVAPHAIACDANSFESAIAAGKMDVAAELYRGDFLPGFHISGAPYFEEWLERERSRLAARYRETLEQLAHDAEHAGDTARAVGWWRRLLDAGAVNTTAVLGLMRALERVGDRAGALVAAREHEKRVRLELDADVDPSVRMLEHELRRASREPEVRPSSATVPVTPAAEERWPAPRSAAPNVVAVEGAPSNAPSARAPIVLARSHGSSRSWMSPRARRLTVGLVASGVIIASAFLSSRGASPSERPGERILVAPLENRTGDSRFDPLGEMAADWIAQGLQETGLVEVIDPLSAIISRRRAESQASGAGLTRAGALAQAAGAGSVVWGAIYRSGDTLFFRAQVSDVSAHTVRVALKPVAASTTDPRDGIEQLRAELAGALAAQLDRSVASVTGAAAKPPTLDAYREYARGLEEFQREAVGGRNAIAHFAAASRIDTSFHSPLVWLVFAYGNRGQRKQADSVVALLAAHRAQLEPLDRVALDAFEARARGDLDGQLKAEIEAAHLSPGSEWSYNVGIHLLNQARPREALGYLQQIDPENGWAREWESYWANLTLAQHWLGEYRQEIAAAERFRAVSGDSRSASAMKTRAMIGLGRPVEAEAQVRALLTATPSTENPLAILDMLADEFAAHGYPAAAGRVFECIVNWPASQTGNAWATTHSLDDPVSRSLRGSVGAALYGLRRWRDARVEFDQLLARDSANIGLRFRATLAAVRDGDRMAAADFSRSLSAAESRGFLGGEYLRAQLALVMGDTATALRHLRIAAGTSDGNRYRFNIHRESDWQAVRDDRRFQALIRPTQ